MRQLGYAQSMGCGVLLRKGQTRANSCDLGWSLFTCLHHLKTCISGAILKDRLVSSMGLHTGCPSRLSSTAQAFELRSPEVLPNYAWVSSFSLIAG